MHASNRTFVASPRSRFNVATPSHTAFHDPAQPVAKLQGNNSMTHYRSLIPACVAFCTALALGSTVVAQTSTSPNDEQVSIKLTYSNADIHTVGGAKRFALRMRVAAATVCGGDDPALRMDVHYADCQQAAIRRATSSLNAPLLADALGLSNVALAQR